MKKYKLNQYISVNQYEDDFYFIFGDYFSKEEKVIHIEKKFIYIMKKLIDGYGATEEELINIFSEMEIQYYITQNVLIDDEIEQDVNSSLSRNKSYFFSNKFNNYDDIRTKSVMILGCGGIGTHVAWNLTTLGIKRLILIDFDFIEESNLNRQILFDTTDIGKEKTSVLKDKLKKINSKIEIDTISINIDSKEKLNELLKNNKVDLIIKSLDSPTDFPYWLDQVCEIENIPYISGITANTAPLIGPTYIPGESEKLSNFFPNNKLHANKVFGISQSLGSVMYHISSEISLEAVRFFTDKNQLKYKNKVLIEDIHNNQSIFLLPNNKIEHNEMKTELNFGMLILTIFFSFMFSLTNLIIFNILGFLSTFFLPILFYRYKPNIIKSTFLNIIVFSFFNSLSLISHGLIEINLNFVTAFFSIVSIFILIAVFIIEVINSLFIKEEKYDNN